MKPHREDWQKPLENREKCWNIHEDSQQNLIGARGEQNEAVQASRAAVETFDELWEQHSPTSFAALAHLKSAVNRTMKESEDAFISNSSHTPTSSLSCWRRNKYEVEAAHKVFNLGMHGIEQMASPIPKPAMVLASERVRFASEQADTCRSLLLQYLQSEEMSTALEDYEQAEQTFVRDHPSAYEALITTFNRELQLAAQHKVGVWGAVKTLVLGMCSWLQGQQDVFDNHCNSFGYHGCLLIPRGVRPFFSSLAEARSTLNVGERIFDVDDIRKFSEVRKFLSELLSDLERTPESCETAKATLVQCDKCWEDEMPDDFDPVFNLTLRDQICSGIEVFNTTTA